eukprot:scaffold122858_cov33-Tisochrysis_lutea.AAC.1
MVYYTYTYTYAIGHRSRQKQTQAIDGVSPPPSLRGIVIVQTELASARNTEMGNVKQYVHPRRRSRTTLRQRCADSSTVACFG